MSGGFEAAGDALTGGIIARAVEPQHGADAVGADGLTHEHACLNCATSLVGSYCHACGQHAHVHRTLSAFGHDLLHGVFHFEGKIWRTIPALFLRPGGLTRRYIEGERARFVSPLALFLFSVFLMFAVFESVGGPIANDAQPPQVKASAETRKASLRKTVVAANDLIATLRAERELLVKNGKPTDDIDKKMDAAAEKLAEAAKEHGLSGGFSLEDLKTSADIDTGSKALDERIRYGLKNPELLLYKLQSSAYKFAWALIPLSLPFMWLIFAWRRQYHMYDHAVFVTYSLCFVMLLLVAMALIAVAGIQTGWMILLVPVHMFVQLRGAYALGKLSAFWRTLVLVSVASVVLNLFGLGLLALGLAG
jgi:hypothetical protein